MKKRKLLKIRVDGGNNISDSRAHTQNTQMPFSHLYIFFCINTKLKNSFHSKFFDQENICSICVTLYFRNCMFLLSCFEMKMKIDRKQLTDQ